MSGSVIAAPESAGQEQDMYYNGPQLFITLKEVNIFLNVPCRSN